MSIDPQPITNNQTNRMSNKTAPYVKGQQVVFLGWEGKAPYASEEIQPGLVGTVRGVYEMIKGWEIDVGFFGTSERPEVVCPFYEGEIALADKETTTKPTP